MSVRDEPYLVANAVMGMLPRPRRAAQRERNTSAALEPVRDSVRSGVGRRVAFGLLVFGEVSVWWL